MAFIRRKIFAKRIKLYHYSNQINYDLFKIVIFYFTYININKIVYWKLIRNKILH